MNRGLDGRAACAGVHFDAASGVALPRAWFAPEHSFEGLGRAMRTMIRVSSGKLADVLRDSMAAGGRDVSPSPGLSRAHGAFFVAFVVLVNYFILNIFTACVPAVWLLQAVLKGDTCRRETPPRHACVVQCPLFGSFKLS